MAKLDSDPSSAAARTSFGAPAKGAAAPQSTYNPRVDTLYESFFNLPAVKAAMPPEAPEQAAQDPPKLPGRKPPGSRPAPKHGDVLHMLSRYALILLSALLACRDSLYLSTASLPFVIESIWTRNSSRPFPSRSGKKGSEDTGGAATGNDRAPAGPTSAAAASGAAVGSTRNTYTGPLISRAGKRGSTAAFSSTTMARGTAEDIRQADSAALYPAQPAYRQASVMDLLNRPQSSSGSRPTEDAAHAQAYAERRTPGDPQHMLQPQCPHQPSSSAALHEGNLEAGRMPVIPGGLGSRLGSPLAGQSPNRSGSPVPDYPGEASHEPEPSPGQHIADAIAPSRMQPDGHDSLSAQPASALAAAAFAATGTEADRHPGSHAWGMDEDQLGAEAGCPHAQPLQAELPADEAAGVVRTDEQAAADEAPRPGQRADNPLAEIDAATWASLPANVQASILAGETVNLEAAMRAPDAPGLAPQVLLFMPRMTLCSGGLCILLH